MSTTRTTTTPRTTAADNARDIAALRGEVADLAATVAAFIAAQKAPAVTPRPTGNAAVRATVSAKAKAKATRVAKAPEVLTFVCVDCGEEGIRKAANQVRCTECRLDREALATTAWAKAREEARPVNKALSALLQEAALPINGAAWKAAKAAKAAGKSDRDVVIAARRANKADARVKAAIANA